MENTKATVQSAAQSPLGLDRRSLIFILFTGFLSSMGIGIINPVAPYLVSRYVTDPNAAGVALAWLTTAYAICQFIAAPGLGVLSDRFGRKPLLLICLFGSVIGYLLLGIGGALWVLILGRIIDGLTGANFSVAYAYIADITPPQSRGQLYGWMGVSFGLGFIFGPAIGGWLAQFGIQTPFYFAAAITLLNVIYGLFFMPESLSPANRISAIRPQALNPFGILQELFKVASVRGLLIAILLYSIPFAALQSNLSLFTKDVLHWDPVAAGSLFTLVGISDIFVQGLLLPRLLRRFGESSVAIGGLCAEIGGYALIAIVAVLTQSAFLWIGVLVFAMGDGILGPSINALLARGAGSRSQGQVQGGSLSLQSVARIIGPLAGGLAYDRFGHAAPYVLGIGFVALTIITLRLTLPHLPAESAESGYPLDMDAIPAAE